MNLRYGTLLRALASWRAALLVSAGCASTPAPKTVEPVASQAQAGQVLVERAQAFADASDLTRAEQYYVAALDAGADRSLVLPALLRVCVVAKHYRAALLYAEAELSARPEDARLRYLVGSLDATLGRTADARAHLQRAAELLPGDADIQFAYAVFLRDDAADRTNADVYFRRYLQLSPRGSHAEEAMASVLSRVP